MGAGIVYEVNLEVDAGIAAAYRDWLADHVREMLGLPGFISAEIFDEEINAGTTQRWCVHYRLRDRAALQAYFDQHAARMRADGLRRFGDRFRANRRILLPADSAS